MVYSAPSYSLYRLISFKKQLFVLASISCSVCKKLISKYKTRTI